MWTQGLICIKYDIILVFHGDQRPGNALVPESHQHPPLPFAKQPGKPQQGALPPAEELSEGHQVCAHRLCLNQGKCPFTPQKPHVESPDSVTPAPAAIPFGTRVTAGSQPHTHLIK